jgi:uncharacterized protein YacL
MLSASVMRKVEVFRKIRQLPVEEQARVDRLYQILNKIEWLTIFPKGLGMLFTLALLLSLFIVSKLLDINFPVGNEIVLLICAVLGLVFFWATSILILKWLVFNPRRDNAMEAFRILISCNPKYKDALKTIMQLDQDMASNIAKLIAEIVP